MLTLRRVEIENFVCFDRIVVEPSADSDRCLTVIRAENGSGKTTFLRALRWGMYGEKGLPGNASHYSLHPAWWHPDTGEIETQVVIEFETDGSSRNFAESGTETTLYQLVRSVRTISKAATREDEPDFRRIDERTRLMVRDPGGSWSEFGAAPDVIVGELLPWGLRDFFVMDTDEVADFVGGSENKDISRREVEAKTTTAVHSLLGIEVFNKACQRVEGLARSFGGRATKAIGDHDLTELQNRLDHRRAEKDEVQTNLREENARKSELQDNISRRREVLDEELRKSGSHESLRQQLNKNRQRHERVMRERNECLALLAGDLESLDLLAPLASIAISETYEFLKPLHDQGHIPSTHLHFVRGLLESGRCVCGQVLSDDSEHRQHVEHRIAESSAQEYRANYLDQLHDAALSLRGHTESSNWKKNLIAHRANLADRETERTELTLEKKHIDARLEEVKESKIQLLRDEIAAIETQLEACRRSLARQRPKLETLNDDITSLSRQISQRQRNERAAADDRMAEQVSRFVVEVLDRAYRTIEREQVVELSDRMNRLFLQMAANVADDDFDEAGGTKASLRMIVSVGVRPVEDRPEYFEIYALNSRGRAMPPMEINGASRRVLALSFVLALCIESQTRAPLIADSLLNFMSGAVRRNTLRVIAEHSRQPILLLTNSDLEAPSEAETVEKYAGATYTLTGQWDAVDTGSGGDVVNWTERRQVALLCACGPRQYCSVCERNGQARSPGWSRRSD